MRMQLTRQGLWLTNRQRASFRFGWLSLAPLVLTPIVFAICIGIALNRSTTFLRMCRDFPNEGAALYTAFNRTSLENLIALDHPPSQSELPTLQLFVPKNTLTAMHEASVTGDPQLGHDPGGDRPYYRAFFRDESGQLQKAKIAYRGLMHYHHWPEKPSLRVKIKKDDIALGRRYVELTRPKDALAVRHQLPEHLARELGIVTTINDPVRLFINNKYCGVYLRSYRCGESLALANERMPGSFFKGDCVMHNDHLNLWESSANWKLFGEVNEQSTAFFDEFLAIVRQTPSAESVVQLQEYLDAECFAKWAACMIATGCIHTDARHNQTYFYCTNQGKLEIMPWDPTCYEVAGRDFTPVDTVNHPVMDHMTRDPRWVHRRNEWLYQLINGPASATAINEHLDAKLARMLPDLKADPYLSKKTIGMGRMPRSVWDIDEETDEIKRWAIAKEPFLRDYLEDARVCVEPISKQPPTCRVTVFGAAAVCATHRDGSAIDVRDEAGGTTDLFYPGLTETILTAVFQPHDNEKELPYVSTAAMIYEINVSPNDVVFRNAITGAIVEPTPRGPEDLPVARTLPASIFPVEPTGDVVLGPGAVVLERDLKTGPQQTLIIKPGTTLRLHEGVGIYARGRVLAQGTADRPIRFEPAGDQPWAAFGAGGANTAGSRFEHVTAFGGSLGSLGGLRFKGMFNVYDCPDVVLKHCTFHTNKNSDDTVNLAESHVLVQDCTIKDGNADGLDLDRCTGLVERCHWVACGNDGLDMMTCQIHVRNCSMTRSGDKGISVGEGSRVLVEGCQIDRCLIGIEVKDASRVAVLNSVFTGNETGYHAYQKKWLYPRGGSALFGDCQIHDSVEDDLSLEKRSDGFLLRTSVKVDDEDERRVTILEELDADWTDLIESLQTP